MARQKTKKKRTAPSLTWLQRWRRRLKRAVLYSVLFVLVLVFALGRINPPITHTMWAERVRLGSIDRQWVPIEEISPDLRRAVVAAEDANFCAHWGFDMAAIRLALEGGGQRGASTLTQQTVKNVFLWQGRSWFRKAVEALLTPVVELMWSKKRILEVYLNVAEFGAGVFGADAAAHTAFRVPPSELSLTQAAGLAAVLPNPKERSAADPTDWLRQRAASIADGAQTIAKDGRAACFED